MAIKAIGGIDKDWMTKVTLRPEVSFPNDKQPSYEQLENMNHKAHELCFIANSVRSEIVTEIIT
jgi:organic hydroperoxide reductase OsmC/OhrA